MNIKYFSIIGMLLISQLANSQHLVAITIDDVPNTSKFEKDNFKSALLEKLDSLNIPIAIFINEGLIYKTDAIVKNFSLLNSWIQRDYVTLGNHAFSHSRYSTAGYEYFTNDILLGEAMTRQISKKYNKPLNYFRFPYNDLGKDSLQHLQIRSYLNTLEYIIAPFTIESSDWMYNYVYKHYLERKDFEKANEIGKQYIVKTLDYFDFFEAISMQVYGRNINHIYLCHDNQLNADMLPQLIFELKKKRYKFISLEEALTDEAYQQKDNYYKKWGVSWINRWMQTSNHQSENMEIEPPTKAITKLYEEILKEKSETR